MDEATTGDCEPPAREAAADKMASAMASASPASAMPECHCAGGHVCCTEHQGYADCKDLPSHRSQLQLPLNIIFPNGSPASLVTASPLHHHRLGGLAQSTKALSPSSKTWSPPLG
jgi:hypothetical protein